MGFSLRGILSGLRLYTKTGRAKRGSPSQEPGSRSHFFDVSTIDDRFARQDDSVSWPELLTGYDVIGMAGSYIPNRQISSAEEIRADSDWRSCAQFRASSRGSVDDRQSDLGENRYPTIRLWKCCRNALSATRCFAKCFHSQRQTVLRAPDNRNGSRRFLALASRGESPVFLRPGIDELAA